MNLCHVLIWYGKPMYGYGKPLCFLKVLGREDKKGNLPLLILLLQRLGKRDACVFLKYS